MIGNQAWEISTSIIFWYVVVVVSAVLLDFETAKGDVTSDELEEEFQRLEKSLQDPSLRGAAPSGFRFLSFAMLPDSLQSSHITL